MSENLTSESIAQYFASADVAFGGSNYLSMCATAVNISHASVECRACDGMGFRPVDHKTLQGWARRLAEEVDPDKLAQIRVTMTRENNCLVCNGSGYTTQRRIDMAHAMHPMFTTVRCSRCQGCGETFPPNDVTAERQDMCLGCMGDMYIVPVTVKEKGSTKSGKPPKREPGGEDDDAVTACSDWVDEDAWVKRGQVGRQIDALRRQDPVIGDAMATYYGIQGDKWGPHKWGRRFALWQYTASGQRLAREGHERSKRGHGFTLAPLDLIAGERDADLRLGTDGRTTSEYRHRHALIGQADKEARDLYERMVAAISGREAA